jgi:hypothetical protein
VQLQHPGVVLAAERLVLAAAPLNAAAVVGWGLVASLGASAAPFYLSAYQAALYAACSLPLRSSFWSRGGRPSASSAGRGVLASTPPEALALAPNDAALHAFAAATLPPALYAATHASALLHPFGAPNSAWAEHASALILLAAAPLAALCAGAGRGALWWAPPGVAAAREAVSLATAFALAVAFHGRVLRRLLRAYVRVAPPWDVALPATAAACVAAVAALAVSGRLPPPGRRGAPEPPEASLAAALLAIAALAASLALGMPPWMAPAPLLGAAAAWQFCRYGAARDYALWGLSSAACLLWFLRRHFWTLDVTLADGLPLRALCGRLACAALLAGCAPAAIRAARGRGARTAAAALLAAHAALHAACESALVAEGAAEGEAAAIYPPYLVAATSVAGLALVGALRRAGRLPPWAAWLLACVYGAKLALLLVPDGAALPRLTALAAAASGPFALPAPRARAASALAAALHVAGFALAALAARFELFDTLRFAAGGRRPSDATLFGSLLLGCGAFCAALAARRFPYAAPPRRFAAALAAAGAGLLALRPPLPWKGEVGFWYDAVHVPDAEPDDAAMYGARAGDRAAWPAWLLLAAAQAAMLAATAPRGKASASWAARGDGLPARGIAAAAALGAALGLYAAAEFFPPDDLLRLFVAAPCALGGVLVAALAASPGAAPPPRWLPLLFAAQLAALPAALAALRLGAGGGALGALGGRGAAEAAARAAEARAGVLATHAALCCAAAFSVKLKLAAVAAEARGASGGAAVSSRGGRPFAVEAYPRSDPFAPFAARAGGAGGRAPLLAARALAAARATALPPLGNAAAVAAYGLSLALSRGAGSEGGCGPAFALPPLLLLLSDDGGLLRGLGEGSARYAPPFAAAWLHLTALGALRAASSGAAHAADAPWGAARNALALALAQPCGALLLRALWGAPQPPDALVLALTPLPLAPLALADGAPARYLALLALLGAGVMHGARSRSRAAAHRLL